MRARHCACTVERVHRHLRRLIAGDFGTLRSTICLGNFHTRCMQARNLLLLPVLGGHARARALLLSLYTVSRSFFDRLFTASPSIIRTYLMLAESVVHPDGLQFSVVTTSNAAE